MPQIGRGQLPTSKLLRYRLPQFEGSVLGDFPQLYDFSLIGITWEEGISDTVSSKTKCPISEMQYTHAFVV
jgi:hypothetical protein